MKTTTWEKLVPELKKQGVEAEKLTCLNEWNTFPTWKYQFNRTIKKGEKGKKVALGKTPSLWRKGGEILMEERKTKNGTKLVPVIRTVNHPKVFFHISQTQLSNKTYSTDKTKYN